MHLSGKTQKSNGSVSIKARFPFTSFSSRIIRQSPFVRWFLSLEPYVILPDAYQADKGRLHMPTSKLQSKLYEALTEEFPVTVIKQNYRAEWLTGLHKRSLELDLYLPELNLAIEVQGQQHFQEVTFFHKNVSGFEVQVERDSKKRDQCYGASVILLEVTDESEISQIISLIHSYKESPFCLSYTRDQWAGFRKSYVRQRTKDTAYEMKKLHIRYKQLAEVPRVLRDMEAFEQVKAEIRVMVEQHNQAKFEAVMQFASRFMFIYELLSRDVTRDVPPPMQQPRKQRYKKKSMRRFNYNYLPAYQKPKLFKQLEEAKQEAA
jgi:hypothetical protein